MTSFKPNRDKYNRIAIIRLSALGDIVHTIPAFHILRTSFPNAKISWFAEPAGSKLLSSVSGIDEIITTHFKVKGVLNKYRQVRRLVNKYKNCFDAILDFQGLIKSATLASLLKGEDTLGFARNNLREPQARLFYSRQAPHFDENRHVIYKNMHLVSQLDGTPDLPCDQFPVEYPLKPLPANQHLKDFLNKNQLQKNNFLLLNVGGGWETKTLSESQYIDIVESIKSRYRVVILWGNSKEKQKALRVSEKTHTLMSSFLDFSELMELIQQAALIVTSDTLALHLADMLKTPSVGIFGPTSPDRNGSLLPQSLSVYEKMLCNFCYKKKCGTIDCIKKINISAVTHAIDELMNRRMKETEETIL